MEGVWILTYCPDCKAINWQCTGDLEFDGDLSRVDPPSVIQCYSCNKKYIPYSDKELICESQDMNLWEDVEHNVNDFISQAEYDEGIQFPPCDGKKS